MKIYISGPITGLPYQEARAKFCWAEEIIRQAGHTAINPTDLPKGLTWGVYMQIACSIIGSGEPDAIYMMEGWRESRGSMIEWLMARAMKIQTLYEEEEDRRVWGGEKCI